MDKTKSVPEGYRSITPYMIVDGAKAAIDFYTKAFGASERMRIDGPNGKLGHTELTIGDSVIMLSDEWPDMNCRGPKSYGGSPVTIHLYVADVDAVVARAVGLGAKLTRPVADQFYGDRSGTLEDPFGHFWHLATRVEDMSLKEMQRRAKEYMAKKPAG